ncbi:MAG: tRNA (adenosine(37)-N6)-threonylcarbamoyltransferase complex ATPase subunit type 1 TsaE [Leifsonia xyli]|nr:MAG: tRNA (adenosine(37)-N6)-threonylcarbamoyltransferase complex ATPase subunit type 1 TsaE [Leifsonia xyli]
MEALGARLAGLLRVGDVVLLNGELGAGKTTLTRGLGAALGARGAVTSPTFVLARTHPTASGVPLVHVDAYRLATAAEVDDLDLDLEGSITVVEWGAGKLEGVLDSWLELDIARPLGGAPASGALASDDAPASDDPASDAAPRHVRLTPRGPRWLGQTL